MNAYTKNATKRERIDWESLAADIRKLDVFNDVIAACDVIAEELGLDTPSVAKGGLKTALDHHFRELSAQRKAERPVDQRTNTVTAQEHMNPDMAKMFEQFVQFMSAQSEPEPVKKVTTVSSRSARAAAHSKK